MSATPTPTAPMRWRGVVIDNLIPSLFSVDIIIFTSTKSEHSDSPWCEPITPLFSEVRLSEAKKQPSYLVVRTDARVRTMFCQVLTIDACGQALSLDARMGVFLRLSLIPLIVAL